MKVLIGLDDSAHAESTLEYVRGMSWPADTSIVVASAVQLPLGDYSETYAPIAVNLVDWLKKLSKFHQELAERGAQKLKKPGLNVQCRVLQGDPRDALIEEAKKEHADLLVVGSHGRTGIEKLLMGSVAAHVVSHAPCSVLVVRRSAEGRHARPD